MENLLWRQQTEPEGDMDDDSSRVGHVHPPAPAPAPAPTAAAATQQTAKREHSDSVSHARPMVTARLELPTGFNAAEALKLKARVIEPDGKRLPARITMDSRQPAGRNCDVLRIVFQPQRTGLHQVVVSVDGVLVPRKFAVAVPELPTLPQQSSGEDSSGIKPLAGLPASIRPNPLGSDEDVELIRQKIERTRVWAMQQAEIEMNEMQLPGLEEQMSMATQKAPSESAATSIQPYVSDGEDIIDEALALTVIGSDDVDIEMRPHSPTSVATTSIIRSRSPPRASSQVPRPMSVTEQLVVCCICQRQLPGSDCYTLTKFLFCPNDFRGFYLRRKKRRQIADKLRSQGQEDLLMSLPQVSLHGLRLKDVTTAQKSFRRCETFIGGVILQADCYPLLVKVLEMIAPGNTPTNEELKRVVIATPLESDIIIRETEFLLMLAKLLDVCSRNFTNRAALMFRRRRNDGSSSDESQPPSQRLVQVKPTSRKDPSEDPEASVKDVRQRDPWTF